ncbi:MAG: hypothetical protein ACRCY4_03305 [Brevinema sp.]
MRSIRWSEFLALAGFSLIYSVDTSLQAIIVSLALIIFYPLFVVMGFSLLRLFKVEKAYIIILFGAVLLMSLYLHNVSLLDPKAVEGLFFRASASMAAAPFVILGLIYMDHGLAIEREHRMMREGVILVLIIISFSTLREILKTGAIDLRFAGWGDRFEIMQGFAFPKVRAVGMLLMAAILGLISFFEERPHA